MLGAFDLFHAGHIEFLRKARELGSFLLVGVHRDDVVNDHKVGISAFTVLTTGLCDRRVWT